MRYVLCALYLALLSSCATPMLPPTPDRYVFEVTDNIQARRFDLVLKSLDEKALCISTEDWPANNGKYPVDIDEVKLKTVTGVLPVRSNLFSAYCPAGCGRLRVDGGGVLRGFISYEAFGNPDALANDTSKELLFAPRVDYCR